MIYGSVEDCLCFGNCYFLFASRIIKNNLKYKQRWRSAPPLSNVCVGRKYTLRLVEISSEFSLELWSSSCGLLKSLPPICGTRFFRPTAIATFAIVLSTIAANSYESESFTQILQDDAHLNVKSGNVCYFHGSQTEVKTALCLVHLAKGWCNTNLCKKKKIITTKVKRLVVIILSVGF